MGGPFNDMIMEGFDLCGVLSELHTSRSSLDPCILESSQPLKLVKTTAQSLA